MQSIMSDCAAMSSVLVSMKVASSSGAWPYAYVSEHVSQTDSFKLTTLATNTAAVIWVCMRLTPQCDIYDSRSMSEVLDMISASLTGCFPVQTEKT